MPVCPKCNSENVREWPVTNKSGSTTIRYRCRKCQANWQNTGPKPAKPATPAVAPAIPHVMVQAQPKNQGAPKRFKFPPTTVGVLRN